MRSFMLSTVELGVGLVLDVRANDGVGVAIPSDAVGVMEKEGVRGREVKSPWMPRDADRPDSLSIDGRGTSGSCSTSSAILRSP